MREGREEGKEGQGWRRGRETEREGKRERDLAEGAAGTKQVRQHSPFGDLRVTELVPESE